MTEERARDLAPRTTPRGRTIVTLFAVIVVFNALVFPTVAGRLSDLARHGAFRPLDLKLSYTPDEAHALIGSLAPDARRLYLIVESTADVVYPVVYAFFLYLLARWLLAKSAGHPRWIHRGAVVPFAAMIADWLENAGIVTLIAIYPRRADALAWFSSGITTTKWVCFILSVVLVLYAAARAVVRRRGRASAAT